MKINFIISVAVATMLSGTAYAAGLPTTESGFFFRPYIGADYQYTNMNYRNISGEPFLAGGFPLPVSPPAYSYSDVFPDEFESGGDGHIGVRVHKYLGFEAGYFDTASSTKKDSLDDGTDARVRLYGWTLDAMGYLPLGASQRFELIGTAGVARTTASGRVTALGNTYSLGDNVETEFRAGGGAEYWLTDSLNMRGIVRYQTADFNETANYMVTANVGVNWQF